ncbi:hypothetical protein C7M84_014510, partial [Penaeus vannamei]
MLSGPTALPPFILFMAVLTPFLLIPRITRSSISTSSNRLFLMLSIFISSLKYSFHLLNSFSSLAKIFPSASFISLTCCTSRTARSLSLADCFPNFFFSRFSRFCPSLSIPFISPLLFLLPHHSPSSPLSSFFLLLFFPFLNLSLPSLPPLRLPYYLHFLVIYRRLPFHFHFPFIYFFYSYFFLLSLFHLSLFIFLTLPLSPFRKFSFPSFSISFSFSLSTFSSFFSILPSLSFIFFSLLPPPPCLPPPTLLQILLLLPPYPIFLLFLICLPVSLLLALFSLPYSCLPSSSPSLFSSFPPVLSTFSPLSFSRLPFLLFPSTFSLFHSSSFLPSPHPSSYLILPIPSIFSPPLPYLLLLPSFLLLSLSLPFPFTHSPPIPSTFSPPSPSPVSFPTFSFSPNSFFFSPLLFPNFLIFPNSSSLLPSLSFPSFSFPLNSFFLLSPSLSDFVILLQFLPPSPLLPSPLPLFPNYKNKWNRRATRSETPPESDLRRRGPLTPVNGRARRRRPRNAGVSRNPIFPGGIRAARRGASGVKRRRVPAPPPLFPDGEARSGVTRPAGGGGGEG